MGKEMNEASLEKMGPLIMFSVLNAYCLPPLSAKYLDRCWEQKVSWSREEKGIGSPGTRVAGSCGVGRGHNKLRSSGR